MALGIVKYAYDRSSQLIGFIWFAVCCRGPHVLAPVCLFGVHLYMHRRRFWGWGGALSGMTLNGAKYVRLPRFSGR